MMYQTIEPITIPFKDLLTTNSTVIRSYMKWENYGLNDVDILVNELVKDHSLMVLEKSYGNVQVEEIILDELIADIFIYFPVLLQQLSITRLIDAYGVVKDDTDSITTIRTENLTSETDQTGTATQGTSQIDNNTINMQNKTTGTVIIDENSTDQQDSTTTINNTSGVEGTGSRNVNLSHNMPEQSIDGITGNIPTDAQGTPILVDSYIQQAEEGFSTSNPINSSELSEQIIANTTTGGNDSTTTNDLTVADTGTNIRTVTNSGSDTTENLTATTGINNINETVNTVTTNKQYAYEIKAFLETSDSLIAFSKWENRFSWVCGIL